MRELSASGFDRLMIKIKTARGKLTKEKEVKRLFAKGLSKSEIARQIGIGRTSVRRMLA